MSTTHFLFFFQLAAGSMLMLPFLPREQLGPVFFKAIAGGCFIVTAAGIGIQGLADPMASVAPAVGAVACLLYITTVSIPRSVLNRVLHALATASLFCAAVFSPAHDWYSYGSTLGSTLSMGAIMVAMILGHWYLALRDLPFVYLRNMVFAGLAFVIANGIVQLAYLIAIPDAWAIMRSSEALGFAGSGELLLFMRWVFGILGPAILLVMSWRCIQIRSNQSATGILYVVSVFILLGELTAGLLA